MGNRFEITSELKAYARHFANEFKVSDKIHSNDLIFQFFIENPLYPFKRKIERVHYYFSDGFKSTLCLSGLMKQMDISPSDSPSILEFASGYGRMTRHFQNVFPTARTVSCDIHEQAIHFINNDLGRDAVLSHSDPECLSIDEKFDVVFALSFFSHMPRSTWTRWLQALYSCVKPGGVLIFTTQGLMAAKYVVGNPRIPEHGFWYKEQSEQYDIDEKEYGQTVVTKSFVTNQMKYLENALLARFTESFWWDIQDLYVIKKSDKSEEKDINHKIIWDENKSFLITDELKYYAKHFAKECKVNEKIHPDDYVYRFYIKNPYNSFTKKVDAVRFYFYDGFKSTLCLSGLMKQMHISPSDSPSVLEFASGYGRMTRHFQNVFPTARTVSCDIHEQAIHFINNDLGRDAVLSHSDPECLSIDEKFDVVFALSFFSHMPRSTWTRWLQALYSCVKPGGVLIFTTQGLKSAKLQFGNPEIPEHGFWYKKESEQHDIDTNDYGITVVTRPFVLAQIKNLGNARLAHSSESFWWSMQDLYIISRSK